MDTTETPTPPSTPAEAPTAGRHRRRPWRAALAGAVAGGVLAAGVTGPVTWALTREDAVAAAPSGGTQDVASSGLPDIQQLPDVQEQQPPTLPDEPTTGGTDRSDWTDATTDEAQGLVLIETTLTDGEAAGTGLALDSSGLVLTNYHVVEGSTSATVTIASDGTIYDAEVLGFDATSDIAVLQLDGASGLATVDLDDDGDPAVADEVTAVGNAEGQGYLSASSGEVVALEQSITADTEQLSGLIETDAYVVGGFSGGALLDDEGEVVGITTAASTGGVAESYAIPVEDALAVAERIESGEESDGVQIGASAYLGLGIAETTSGLGVAEVEDGGAAAAAGVEAGDVLTAVGGTAVRSIDALRSALAAYEPGDRTTLRWRTAAGTTRHATATLGSSPVA